MSAAAQTTISRSDLRLPTWLEYDDEVHVYLCDGAPMRAATEWLREVGVGLDYDNLPPFIQRNVSRARWRSKIVHRSWAESFLDLLLIDEVPDEALVQLQKALDLTNSRTFEPLTLEQAYADRELWLAGTPDFVGLLDERYAIADLKGTHKLDEHYCSMQLTTYAELVDRTLRRRGIEPPDWELWVLWVPLNKKAKLVQVERDYTGFELLYE